MPTPEKFASKLAAALRRAGAGENVQYLPQDFALAIDGRTFNLHNAFAEYQRAGLFRRGSVIRHWVASTIEAQQTALPASFDEARAALVPYVKDAAFYGQIALMQRTRGEEPPAVPTEALGGDLTVAVAYDGPRTIMSIGAKQLADWGVSLADALKAARLNIRMRSPQGLAAIAPGLYQSPYQDCHDAARIVLTEVISRLDLRGDPVAIAAHRNHLFVTGSEDDANLIAAANLAMPLLEDGRRISGTAVSFRGGRWQDFLPPEGTPAHEPLRRLRLRSLGQDYAHQQELLQKVEGEQVFVAGYQVVELRERHGAGPAGADGVRWCSYCVWSEGVPSLLPRTDLVFLESERFGEGDPRRGPRRWEAVEQVVGSLMQPRDLRPVRFAVSDFPDAAALEKLPPLALARE